MAKKMSLFDLVVKPGEVKQVGAKSVVKTEMIQGFGTFGTMNVTNYSLPVIVTDFAVTAFNEALLNLAGRAVTGFDFDVIFSKITATDPDVTVLNNTKHAYIYAPTSPPLGADYRLLAPDMDGSAVVIPERVYSPVLVMSFACLCDQGTTVLTPPVALSYNYTAWMRIRYLV